MRLVSYNIQYSLGKDGKYNLARIADEVDGADIIALQEVERFWQRSNRQDQVAELLRLLPDYYWVYGAGVNLNCPNEQPGQLNPKRQQFGNMLLSRTPIIFNRHHLLPKYGSIGPLSIQRSMLETVVVDQDSFLRICCLHLTHLSAQTRLPQLQRIIDILNQANIEGPPVMGALYQGTDWDKDLQDSVVAKFERCDKTILLGDYNFESDSAEYELLAGPTSPYGGRISNPMGFMDAWLIANPPEVEGATCDVNGRPARLDYAFISANLRDRVSDVSVDHQAQGSDHQPLWLELDD